MTTALLLRDAEAALARVAQNCEVAALEAAFQCWLRGEAPPSDAEKAFASPLRDYIDVALAALGEIAGWRIDSTRLEDGLRWLVDVALDRVGVPAPVVTDGLAHVCLGFAARERPWLAAWHDQVLARATTVHPEWLAGGGRVARGEVSICAPELRVALASRGIATSADADAHAVLTGLLRGELPEDAFHAQVLLTALDWTRRAAPVVLPGQATGETVARLLAEAPRALQQWPWEDKPKTKNSRAAKWHVDNEYHVQALLWAMLAPIFTDLRREEYAPQVGPIQPRIDFGIPSLKLVIEAKFARTRAALKAMVNEIAQDHSTYFTSSSPYEKLIVFIWDNAGHSEDYADIRDGMRKFDRVVDAVIVSRPGHIAESSVIGAGADLIE